MKSSHFCKLAVTASLVMGIVSGAQAAGSNTAKVTFLGNIVDSPCSVTLDTEDQTVNMGSSIGNGTLSNGKTTINNARTFHIDLEGCTWATEKNMNVVFTTGSGTTAATGATDNLALMKTDGTGAISNVSWQSAMLAKTISNWAIPIHRPLRTWTEIPFLMRSKA